MNENTLYKAFALAADPHPLRDAWLHAGRLAAYWIDKIAKSKR